MSWLTCSEANILLIMYMNSIKEYEWNFLNSHEHNFFNLIP